MRSLVRAISDFFRRAQYMPNNVSASIIRNFALGTLRDPGDWDDLETVNHSNPDVDLAVRLCWYFAGEYPPGKSTEYCGRQAMPYFLAVAEALDKGLFSSINHTEIIKSLKDGRLPDEVKRLLKI